MVQGVSEGFHEATRDRRRRFQGRRPGANLNLSLGFSHPIAVSDSEGHQDHGGGQHQDHHPGHRQENSLARSRPISAVIIRRNLTRAKACATPANRFVARKARPFNKYGDDFVRQRGSAFIERIRKRVAARRNGRAWQSIFPGKHVYAQVIDDDAGRTWSPLHRLQKRSLLGENKAACKSALRRKRSARQSRNACSRRRSTRSFLIAAGFFTTAK